MARNKEWVFSGVGVFVLGGTISMLIRKLFGPKNEPLPAAAVNNVTQTPTITNIVSPSFTFPPQVANPDVRKEEPAASSPAPVKGRANLSVEAISLGKIYLQDDIWTLNPVRGVKGHIQHRALLMDIANVPTLSRNIGDATVKGVLRIEGRTYSPLPWLEEYTNAVRLGPADRRTVVLAVGVDYPLEAWHNAWHVVLNQRGNFHALAESEMDWTNMAPLTSDLSAEVLLVEPDTGELLAKFDYFWTFDLNSNSPFLNSE